MKEKIKAITRKTKTLRTKIVQYHHKTKEQREYSRRINAIA